jgi:elongation factor P
MYSTSDFKKNLKVLIDSVPYAIVDFQHVKPGKGNQFTRTKLKNILTGSNLERTFKSGEKFEVPDIEFRDVTYIYADDNFNFMDQKNFEQFQLSAEVLGDTKLYLKENMEVSMILFNGRAISVELPNHVVLRIQQTDPGLKGNTVSNTTKPATLESGAVVQVPLHINEGDLIKVDTTEGSYIERVSKE